MFGCCCVRVNNHFGFCSAPSNIRAGPTASRQKNIAGGSYDPGSAVLQRAGTIKNTNKLCRRHLLGYANVQRTLLTLLRASAAAVGATLLLPRVPLARFTPGETNTPHENNITATKRNRCERGHKQKTRHSITQKLIKSEKKRHTRTWSGGSLNSVRGHGGWHCCVCFHLKLILKTVSLHELKTTSMFSLSVAQVTWWYTVFLAVFAALNCTKKNKKKTDKNNTNANKRGTRITRDHNTWYEHGVRHEFRCAALDNVFLLPS